MKALNADKIVRWAYSASSACPVALNEQNQDASAMAATVSGGEGKNVYARALPIADENVEASLPVICGHLTDGQLLFLDSKAVWRRLHDEGIDPIGIAYKLN